MGLFKFRLPPSLSEPNDLGHSYVTGQDRTPSQGRVEVRDDVLTIHRETTESGRVFVPWPVAGYGRPFVGTATLAERARTVQSGGGTGARQTQRRPKPACRLETTRPESARRGRATPRLRSQEFRPRRDLAGPAGSLRAVFRHHAHAHLRRRPPTGGSLHRTGAPNPPRTHTPPAHGPGCHSGGEPQGVSLVDHAPRSVQHRPGLLQLAHPGPRRGLVPLGSARRPGPLVPQTPAGHQRGADHRPPARRLARLALALAGRLRRDPGPGPRRGEADRRAATGARSLAGMSSPGPPLATSWASPRKRRSASRPGSSRKLVRSTRTPRSWSTSTAPGPSGSAPAPFSSAPCTWPTRSPARRSVSPASAWKLLPAIASSAAVCETCSSSPDYSTFMPWSACLCISPSPSRPQSVPMLRPPNRCRCSRSQWPSAPNDLLQKEWAARWIALAVAKPFVRSVTWLHASDAQAHLFPHAGLLRTDGQPKPLFAWLKRFRGEFLG